MLCEIRIPNMRHASRRWSLERGFAAARRAAPAIRETPSELLCTVSRHRFPIEKPGRVFERRLFARVRTARVTRVPRRRADRVPLRHDRGRASPRCRALVRVEQVLRPRRRRAAGASARERPADPRSAASARYFPRSPVRGGRSRESPRAERATAALFHLLVRDRPRAHLRGAAVRRARSPRTPNASLDDRRDRSPRRRRFPTFPTP
jgi:hypothetical protein